MFLMDSGQFEGADFKSDVCQLVSVEHFSRKTYFQDGCQKYKRNSIVSLSTQYKSLFIVCFVVYFVVFFHSR